MARAGKSALVLCMDVGFSMSDSGPGQEPSFEQAKKVIQKFLQRQVFAETKDEVALVLFGCDGTDNPLATDGQYQNIRVQRRLMMPDFQLLQEVEMELQPEEQQADWLDAVVVCMDLLQTDTMGKKFEHLNIVVLTDLNVQTSADQLELIVQNLKRANISLQFFLPFPVDAENAADGESGGPSHDRGKGLSVQQRRGLELLRRMMNTAEEDEIEIHCFSDALEKLSVFKRLDRRPMAWPCQLKLGSSICIRIVGYKAVTEEKVKKSWTVVDAQTHRRDDVKRETVYCLNDDEETEVQKDYTIQGFLYGSDIIPFSKVDEDQMKYQNNGKCFTVLGFCKQELVSRHHFMGSQVVRVFAPRDDEHAAVALSALIHALDELKMVAIVRYAYDKRSNPQVGAAFPCVKEKYECLHYVQLPFMEDLRHFTFPSLNQKKFTPSESQLSAVDSLIDSMMLLEKDEDGQNVDLLKVHHIPNPQFQRLFQCLHQRGLKADAPLPPVEPWLKRLLEPPGPVATRCQAPLREVKSQFPLKLVVKMKEQKTSADVFGRGAEEPDVKKVKLDEETEFNLAEISAGHITSVGSVNPATDYVALIREKTLSFDQASEQLICRMEQLLGNRSVEYYMKSVTCVQAFRQQSVSAGNAELFNGFFRSLKSSVPERGLRDFWNLLAKDVLTLITEEEVHGSSVSQQQADQFMLMEQEEAQEPLEDPDAGDVDDLLDMM